MNVQKNVCFVSKITNLNVQKDPGYTIQKAIPGGTTPVNLPPEFVKFRNHRCITNSPEIIEFLREVMEEKPVLGIREIREKTKEETYQEEMAKLKDQVVRTEKAKADLPSTEQVAEEIAESPEEEKIEFKFNCPDCDFKSNDQRKYQGHCVGARHGKYKKN